MEAKPICIIYFNRETLTPPSMSYNDSLYSINNNLQSKLNDYHVLVIPSTDRTKEDLWVEVFNAKDASPIDIQELKDHILTTIK